MEPWKSLTSTREGNQQHLGHREYPGRSLSRGLIQQIVRITLAASVNNATERPRSSLIVEKAEAGLRGAARMSVSAAMRSPAQPATPVSAITTQYLRAFIEEVTQDCSWLASIGRVRMRLPVTAKIALVIAGVTQAPGASPNPQGASVFLTMCVSTTGTSFIRMGR